MITVVSASVPLFALAESCTDGKSLSAITMFCDVVAPKDKPADGLLSARVAVSLPSIKASSTTVNVAVPVV